MNGGIDFRLAGIPVRVLWMFFVVTLLLGFDLQDPVLIALWIGVVFVSILAHELGHAFAYRRFGVEPSIVLHGFGGLTFGRSLPVGRDLIVSLAGPGTGLAIGLPLLYIGRTVTITNATVADLLSMAIFVNVFWSLVNLLPLLPLDGGNAANALLSLVFRRDMTHVARVLSIVTAVALIGLGLRYNFLYGALLAGYFLYMNIQALRAAGPGRGTPIVTTARRDFVPPRPTPTAAAPPATPPAAGPGPTHATPEPAARPPLTGAAPAFPSAPPMTPPTAPPGPAPTAAAPDPRRPGPSGSPRRTFAHEVDVAARALTRDEPELASIALDRAARLVTSDDDRLVLDHLHAEVARRLDAR